MKDEKIIDKEKKKIVLTTLNIIYEVLCESKDDYDKKVLHNIIKGVEKIK